MKKKLIATLVAGAVLSTGLIGLTACGTKTPTVEMPTGSSVADAAAWAKAFEDTLKLDNIAYENYSTSELEAEGTVNKNYSPYASKQENVSNIDVKYSSKGSSYALKLYDKANDKAYSESITNTDGKGTYAGVEQKVKSSYTSKSYYEINTKEARKDYNGDPIKDADGNTVYNKTYWKATYSKSNSKGTDGKGSGESYWSAEKYNNFMSNPLSSLSELSLSKKKVDKIEDLTDAKDIADATPTPIYLMYDAFTYADGVYTAELYMQTYLSSNSATSYVTDLVKYEVKVSISDGIIVGLSLKVEKAEDTAKVKDGYEVKYTYSAETVYAVSKTTDISSKVDKNLTKALDEAKAMY